MHRAYQHHHGCFQKLDVNEVRLHAHVSNILMSMCDSCCALSPSRQHVMAIFGRERISHLRIQNHVSRLLLAAQRTQPASWSFYVACRWHAKDCITTDSLSRSSRPLGRSTPPGEHSLQQRRTSSPWVEGRREEREGEKQQEAHRLRRSSEPKQPRVSPSWRFLADEDAVEAQFLPTAVDNAKTQLFEPPPRKRPDECQQSLL